MGHRDSRRLARSSAPPSRVNIPMRMNRASPRSVDQTMKPIRVEHVAEPGLVVVDVAASDDATVFGSPRCARRTLGDGDR
ncbi:DUF6207 family protein [Streptomyces sp. NPDC017083]|uniref:DUF6207 family protein n=1 Tax=unclassified Streptomyces TaxID=2593676 RepID=UPI0037AB61E0